VVECTGLENQRAARYRGFESLRLRNNKRTHTEMCGFFCYSVVSYRDHEVILFKVSRSNPI
jgi:hypothetical protein